MSVYSYLVMVLLENNVNKLTIYISNKFKAMRALEPVLLTTTKRYKLYQSNLNIYLFVLVVQLHTLIVIITLIAIHLEVQER